MSAFLFVSSAVVVAALATGAAALLLRSGVLHPPFDFGPVDEVLAALFGVVLAILLLFASEHYTDARTHAETEAAGLNDIFRIAGVYPLERDQIRHEVICYAREAIIYEYSNAELGPYGSVVLNSRAARLHANANAIAAKHSQSYLLPSLFDGEIKQSDGQQLRLADRQGRIPSVVWVVILVGVGVIMLFLALRYIPERRDGLLALPAVTIVLTLMVGVIYTLDHPYGPLVRLQPRALKSLLRTSPLTAAHPLPPSVLAPCHLPQNPPGVLGKSDSTLIPKELSPHP